jgi:histidinol-phosphate/aromatic aminotransferase/cobyric acid decarboxylase-like protein
MKSESYDAWAARIFEEMEVKRAIADEAKLKAKLKWANDEMKWFNKEYRDLHLAKTKRKPFVLTDAERARLNEMQERMRLVREAFEEKENN